MTVAKNPYTLLGVAKNATDEEIKSAYRRLAKKLHPDQNPGDSKAAEEFKEVSTAYAFLSDSDKRAGFDRGEIDASGNPTHPFAGGEFHQRGGGSRTSTHGFGFEGSSGIDDILSQIFGGRRTSPHQESHQASGGFDPFQAAGQKHAKRTRESKKGADVAYKLNVPFIDAALGRPQRLTLQNGKTLEIKIPKGFEDGQQIRLKGKGSPSVGMIRGGKPGDALVSLQLQPHPHFSKKGDNITLTLPISLKEAVLGAKIKTPIPEGSVMVVIPPGSTSGNILRLRNKGFTGKGNKRGDLLVTLQVDIPAKDKELRDFVKKWAGPDGSAARKAQGLE